MLISTLLGKSTASGLGDFQDLEYQFDEIGNLDNRKDLRQNITERFEFDGVNRITSATISGTSLDGTTDYSYDNGGNIKYKGDAGCVGNSNERCYFYQSNRPHAVTKVGDVTYDYDANGNMTGDSSGRNISWSRFNKPTLITKGDAEIRFDYGAARERIRQTAIADKTDAASTTTTTLYLGSGYQQIKKPGGITEHHEYLNLPGAGVHYVTYDKGTPKAAATFYLHKDHLGSTDVITGLNQSSQAIVLERQSYGAFGRARKNDWANSFATAASKLTPRGYTGHETLALVGLVHMNGRIYDPEIGRFLSPDPFIQSKASVQNVNRYSYVNNNPLSYTDPSGYFFKALTKFIRQNTLHGYFVKQSNTYSMFSVAAAGVLVGPHAAAGVSALNTGIRGGSRRNVVRAGVFTFVSATASTALHDVGPWYARIGLHGLNGGVLSEAQGGNFRDGFIGAASVEAFYQLNLPKQLGVRSVQAGGNAAYNATVMATLGGTASVIGGGKFANGALSAAFVQMFNHGDHDSRETPLWHSRRNVNNRVPYYEPTEGIPDSGGRVWIYDERFNKYRSDDGMEAKYDNNGIIFPDINGNYTYNFFPAYIEFYQYSIINPMHVKYDVLPHFFYGGNGAYDPNLTTIYGR